MGVIAILINRIRESFGFGVASVSLVPALLSYAIAWLAVSMFLPRATGDPGALLPARTPSPRCMPSASSTSDRLDRVGQLHGAFGATVVTLGWVFILGRVIIISMELNAAFYDRHGSISQVVFSLPLLRIVPHRSPRICRFFDLTGQAATRTVTWQNRLGTGS